MRRKLLPLFLVLLVLLVPFAHGTTTFVGYDSSNLGGASCGTNCAGPNTTDHGFGQALLSPFNGQLFQATAFTGNSVPDHVAILTFPAGTTPNFSSFCCPTGGTDSIVKQNQVFTLQDFEAVGGLSASAFNTVSLASPVTVVSGQWVGVVWLKTSASGNILMYTGSGCGTAGSMSGKVADLAITFGTTSPTIGNTYNSNEADPNGCQMAGGNFQTVASGGTTTVTQCYGNCGSPAVTLVNTNSTHTTNFNSSITLFYQAQSNLNGFIRNETIVMARNYNNGMRLFSGIYLVDLTCTGNGGTPFTAQCPGFLTAAASNAFPGKGKNVMLTNIAIQNGQWFGIAVSGSFTGLDLNDTNASVPLFQNSGITPAQISQSSPSTNPSSPAKPAVYAFIQGNTVTSTPPPGFTSGGGCVVCGIADFVRALGGGIVGALIGVGVIFGIITGGLLYATRIHHPKKEGGGIKGYGVPMELLTIVFILILITFSAAGVLPAYIPILIIALVAFFFTQAIFSGRRGTRTDPTG